MVTAAARLGLADAFDGDTADGKVLAGKLNADPLALERFLRALASIGLIDDRGEGCFALTPMGERLRGDHPESLKGMALHVGTQLSPAFARLHDTLFTGLPPEQISYGPHGFAELDENPDAAAIFNQAMVDNSRRFAQRAAEIYDFTKFASIMDVGGGYGAVLAELLRAAPGARGVILDLAHARDGAARLLDQAGVSDRARYVTGSFFDQFPETADAYMLKYILHDWDDEHARLIVQRVGEAAAKSGDTVLLIEKILPERVQADADHAVALYGDMTMMLWNGRERTEAQFAEMLQYGGLALTRTLPLADNHFLIEARPG